MQKITTTLILCFILTLTYGQTQKRIITYLFTQYTKTIYDRTLGNNPWAPGLGLQLFFNNKSVFSPTIELTGDAYLANDKVLRLNADGTAITDISEMVNLFAGTSFRLTQHQYISVVAGPGFINGQTLFGLKPSFGFYFPKNQRWAGKVSYINIFNRDKTTKNDFGSVSISIGLKLF